MTETEQLITEEQLTKIIKAAEYRVPKDVMRLASIISDKFTAYEINNPQRISYALAHFIFETEGLNKFKEDDNRSHTYLIKKKYYPFYGRGVPHLTWESNYAAYSEFCMKRAGTFTDAYDYIKHPEYLEERLDDAIDVGCWFWTKNGIDFNDLSDRKMFRETCYKLNGPKCSTVEKRRGIMLSIKQVMGWT